MNDDRGSATKERFNWLERAGTDFPCYAGDPTVISGAHVLNDWAIFAVPLLIEASQ